MSRLLLPLRGPPSPGSKLGCLSRAPQVLGLPKEADGGVVGGGWTAPARVVACDCLRVCAAVRPTVDLRPQWQRACPNSCCRPQQARGIGNRAGATHVRLYTRSRVCLVPHCIRRDQGGCQIAEQAVTMHRQALPLAVLALACAVLGRLEPGSTTLHVSEAPWFCHGGCGSTAHHMSERGLPPAFCLCQPARMCLSRTVSRGTVW